ncbi:uncharacterized protein PG998_007575 [Apiospora kogelbergensis]|uniref:Uncharacterized protein n=1 Tax=Apiospora kogelbergensis TaxID=1337665 RepID=A0AAW0QFI4_9PEZI
MVRIYTSATGVSMQWLATVGSGLIWTCQNSLSLNTGNRKAVAMVVYDPPRSHYDEELEIAVVTPATNLLYNLAITRYSFA